MAFLNGSCTRRIFLAGCLAALSIASAALAQTDPLPSWGDGAAKTAILDFVGKLTKEGTPDFVRPEQRIATFDNDGTLWAEQPVYFQLAFAFDEVRRLAPQHPDWKEKEPFKSVLAGEMTGLVALIVHHTDADREWAYDRQSHIGKLDKALDEAVAKGWIVVDMKADWKTVFPPEK